ncbi:T9SS type B sorting domain-containing protein [Flavobacterium sp. LS1P28]|nr:T9SS type B sorting domain-containing protein [Flavobacterium sp. LS1P28]RTY90215.1 T9SS type B sorting domain-containing protein [Flavobacterium sp. RSP46]
MKQLTQNSSCDGSLNGHQLPSGDYWYTATRTDENEYKGHFSLKR